MIKRKIIFGMIAGLLLIGFVIGAEIGFGNIIDSITNKKEDFNIDLDEECGAWAEINITNDYWIGDSFEVWDNNTFIQLYNYTLNGIQMQPIRYAIVINYLEDRLYCSEEQEQGDCLDCIGLGVPEDCVVDEKTCTRRAKPKCLVWDNYDAETMANSGRKKATEDIQTKLCNKFLRPEPDKGDTGDKTPV